MAKKSSIYNRQKRDQVIEVFSGFCGRWDLSRKMVFLVGLGITGVELNLSSIQVAA